MWSSVVVRTSVGAGVGGWSADSTGGTSPSGGTKAAAGEAARLRAESVPSMQVTQTGAVRTIYTGLFGRTTYKQHYPVLYFKIFAIHLPSQLKIQTPGASL
jgi:hypothetical protein